MPSILPERRRPSRWLLAVGWICAVLAVVSAIAAIVVQRSASRPIGEGDVFVSDASRAEPLLDDAPDPDSAVRRARNALGVEAVSLVGGDGVIVASTSANLVGEEVANPLLNYAATTGSFSAVAASIDHAVAIDGVTEWTPGSVLYQVMSPLASGDSALVYYDVTELLARRSRPVGLQSETAELLGLGGVFAVLGVSILIGHTRLTRRHREIQMESELLKMHSEELQATNIELSRAREEAERALALAEEKIRIRSEFVLMINHELRTPLTSVVTGARLLRDHDLDEEDLEQLLDEMVSDGTRLQEIIDQILAVARIENRGLSYELSTVPIGDLATNLHDLPADVRTDPDGGAVGGVRTDVNTLNLVLASLTDNARTHGAEHVRIRCDSQPLIRPDIEVGARPPDAFYIAVQDDGPGIAAEFLPRIFEKFEKSSFSSGTGLGLYMARLMVEALEGSIGVETSPKGTTFQIAIPAVRMPELAAVE